MDLTMSELFPELDDPNVVYIDEYPHLEEKLRLQRLARPAVSNVISLRNVLVFERRDDNEANMWKRWCGIRGKAGNR